MKKIRLFSFLAILILFALLALNGCQKEIKISSIHLKDHDPDTVIERAAEAFRYEDYTVVATYDSGETEELPLSEDMVSEVDQFKFYQEGDHEITVSYKGKQCVFKISVKRANFQSLSFPENNVFTYDGKPHVVEVDGDLPANAVVTYPGGNSFVNAGTYDVTAIVSCEGYVTERLSTTVKIERAKYDMSGVRFDAKEVVFDGKSHSVAVTGTLPEGLPAPTYIINEKATSSAVNAGIYNVIARFINTNPNYEPVPQMETTLTIKPADYRISGVDIVFKALNGQLIDGTTKMYDGLGITFDLNDYTKLSNGISVSFTVFDQTGTVISNSNAITNIVDAGIYTIKTEFVLADSSNYNPIEPIIRRFEVLKLPYPLVGIDFNSAAFTYDQNPHSIVIDGILPGDLTVSYEYYLGNELITDENKTPVQEVTKAGRYTVKAIFTHSDKNREPISDLTATLNIEKFKIDPSVLGFTGELSVEYNGQAYSPQLMSWEGLGGEIDIFNYGEPRYLVLSGSKYIEMHEGERPTEAGSYRVSIAATIREEYQQNYVLSGGKDVQEISADFEILPKKVEVPVLAFTGNPTSTYTGSAQEITYTCDFDADSTTLSAVYFKLNTSEQYVAMAADEKPTTVGAYKLVITISVKDTLNCVFKNGETRMEYSFELVIGKMVINISDLDLPDNIDYAYNGRDPRYEAINSLDAVKKGYVKCTYAWVVREEYTDYWTSAELSYEPGRYSIRYELTIADTENCIFSSGATSIMDQHYFTIV